MIEEGWHLYGTTAVKDGPQPTVIDFSKSVGINLVGKLTAVTPATSHHDKVFGKTLTWWENGVTFKQNFKITGTGAHKAIANIRFMACDNNTCSMPVNVTLTRDIK